MAVTRFRRSCREAWITSRTEIYSISWRTSPQRPTTSSRRQPFRYPPPSCDVYNKYKLGVSLIDGGRTTFPLSRGTVSTSINTLGRVLKDVRRIVEDDPADFAAAFKSVTDYLLFLSVVVGHKAVRRVFAETSLTAVLVPASSRGKSTVYVARRYSMQPSFYHRPDHTKNVSQAPDDGTPFVVPPCRHLLHVSSPQAGTRYPRQTATPGATTLCATYSCSRVQPSRSSVPVHRAPCASSLPRTWPSSPSGNPPRARRQN